MSTTDYGRSAAKHYAAWRPPLHACILATGIYPGERFSYGLDVGCGTGHSTHALGRYSRKVLGIDPSEEMVSRAEGTDNIEFSNEPFSTLSSSTPFDVITFAGCLHYADPAEMLSCLHPLTANPSIVIVYDFEVRLSEYFSCLGFEPGPSDYNHRACFASHENTEFRREKSIARGMSFGASAEQLAHLMLSLQGFREWATTAFGEEHLHAAFSRRLQAFTNGNHQLSARTYLTRYALTK